MSGPSDKAIEAAVGETAIDQWEASIAKEAVRVAYPIIRADVVAEVVAALRDGAGTHGAEGWRDHAADFIERELG